MNKKQLFFYYCGYYNVLQSMADPSKRDKGSTFLAQSIFCFGSFLAGYWLFDSKRASEVPVYRDHLYRSESNIFSRLSIKPLTKHSLVSDAMS